MPRVVVSLSLAIAFIATAAPAAVADGLPVPVDGAQTASVTQPNGEGPRYATVTNGDKTTLLQIDQDGGAILRTRTIDGVFSVPLVTTDGTASGISGDGTRLALINPRTRFPRQKTSFVVVDIQAGGKMRPRPPLTLRGDFSFDALSPSGDAMYLVEYPNRDYNDYAVREYDLEQQRLLPDPVLVAHEVTPDEMRGLPMTRATSPDGRWEYTLYNGGGRPGDEAFIHLLDTERGISHCIDLPMVDGRSAFRVDLGLPAGTGTLTVMRGKTSLAELDTESFALTETPAPTAESGVADPDRGIGLAAGATAVGAALLLVAILALRRRRPNGTLPPDPFDPDAEADAEPTVADSLPQRERVSG